jgi:hypothetical protein
MSGNPLSDAEYRDLMPFDGDRAPPRRHGPSIIRPETMGLDPRRHDPVDPPKQRRRVGPVRHRMRTDKAARGRIVALGELQRDLAVHLITNPEHVVVHERPHTLTVYEVHRDGTIDKFEHVPMFGVRFRDGSVAFVDTRRDDEIDGAWLRRESVLAVAYREDHGAHYSCLRESVVTVRPLLPNLKIMRNAADPADRKAILAVRSVIGRVGLPSSVGAIRRAVSLVTGLEDTLGADRFDRAFSGLMALALAGEVRLDLSVEVGDDTAVGDGAMSVSPGGNAGGMP